MRLPRVPLGAFVVRLPGSRSLHHLEVPTLFAPCVVDLHGRLALRRQVQVLLRQVCPQLPDLKLETVDDGNKGDRIMRLEKKKTEIEKKQREKAKHVK